MLCLPSSVNLYKEKVKRIFFFHRLLNCKNIFALPGAVYHHRIYGDLSEDLYFRLICISKMDFQNDNVGIELFLAHMNIEDFMEAVELIYSQREDEECLSPDKMDENSDCLDVSASRDFGSGIQNGNVRYGNVTDLLAFINMISNTPASKLSELTEEIGVLLNKVRCF